MGRRTWSGLLPNQRWYFLIDDKAHVGNTDPADITAERKKTPEAAVDDSDKSTLGGLWGAMQRPCTQTDATRACELSSLGATVVALL